MTTTDSKQNRPVHPHACGEHNTYVWLRDSNIGSSPRLWGTLLEIRAGRVKNRFIPTPVGNTTPARVAGVPIPVHPHACGEHG